MARSKEEAIVWADEVQRETVRRENGRKIVEKFPQSARGRGRRWEKVVDKAGNIINSPTTNCGSLFDLDDPAARDIRRKQRALGMFPLRSCPVALVMAGEMGRFSIDSKLHEELPCEPGSYNERKPCKHALQEAELRRVAHNEEMSQRIARIRTDEEKLEDMAKLSQEQTAKLVEGFGSVVAKAMETVAAAAQQPAPPTEKRPTK